MTRPFGTHSVNTAAFVVSRDTEIPQIHNVGINKSQLFHWITVMCNMHKHYHRFAWQWKSPHTPLQSGNIHNNLNQIITELLPVQNISHTTTVNQYVASRTMCNRHCKHGILTNTHTHTHPTSHHHITDTNENTTFLCWALLWLAAGLGLAKLDLAGAPPANTHLAHPLALWHLLQWWPSAVQVVGAWAHVAQDQLSVLTALCTHVLVFDLLVLITVFCLLLFLFFLHWLFLTLLLCFLLAGKNTKKICNALNFTHAHISTNSLFLPTIPLYTTVSC